MVARSSGRDRPKTQSFGAKVNSNQAERDGRFDSLTSVKCQTIGRTIRVCFNGVSPRISNCLVLTDIRYVLYLDEIIDIVKNMSHLFYHLQ